MINLYDFLTFNIEKSNRLDITLNGNNENIPYNEKNIVYKAIKLFFEETKITPHNISVYIEKNIPTEAGLAGGSSNAAGTFLALNKVFNNILSMDKLHELCAKLGSDLNVCLEGGCTLATGRGEKVTKLKINEYPVSLIKPNIGISAKEGYEEYSKLENKCFKDFTQKMIEASENNQDIHEYLHNDLELGVLRKYTELQEIKELNPKSVMSGSGSTYFVLSDTINNVNNYWTKTNLKTISTGCEIIE